MAERLGQPDGVLIVDDTGFIKKGSVSTGVQRQYSGTAGRTENCQIGVFAAYASAKGRALVDRELYLPKSWTEDRERCRAARIPEDRPFATKPELARAMMLRALGSALPIAWVTADAAYGQERGFRRVLEDEGVGYVLAVPKSQQVKSPTGSWRIDHVLTGAPDDAWERISCGDGAKGPRVYDWAAARLPAADDENGGGTHAPPLGAGTPQPGPPGGDRLLPRLRTTRDDRRRVGPRGRLTLGHRGVLPGREERVRPG